MKELLHIVELKDQNCEVFYDKLKFIYIELPKFDKKEEELETHFDKWLYVFTHLSQLQDRPQKLQERIFAKLFEAAEIARFTPKERADYEESLKYYRDIKNIVDTAEEKGLEKGMEQGIQKGMEQGIKKGLEEGIKKGREQGREEGREEGRKQGREEGVHQKAIQIARTLKQQGFSTAQIQQLTGLDEVEIEQLWSTNLSWNKIF